MPKNLNGESMTIEFLTSKELYELTEYRRRTAQCKELARLGIKFKTSRSGRPLVLRQVLVSQFSGRPSPKPSLYGPDIDALNEVE